MGTNVGIGLLFLAALGSVAIAGRTIYDSTITPEFVIKKKDRDNVVLVTHNSKKELSRALRKHGIELSSSDADYAVRSDENCFIHVVGVPNPKRMDELLETCLK